MIDTLNVEPDPEPDIRPFIGPISTETQDNNAKTPPHVNHDDPSSPQTIDPNLEPCHQDGQLSPEHHVTPKRGDNEGDEKVNKDDAAAESGGDISRLNPSDHQDEFTTTTTTSSTLDGPTPEADIAVAATRGTGYNEKSDAEPGGRPRLRIQDFAIPKPTAAAWNRMASTVGQVPNNIRDKKNDDIEGGRKKKLFVEPGWGQSFKNALKAQKLLFLVPVLLPISWALHFTHQDPAAVFTVSLLAVVPLASGLSFATEELAIRLGDAWGGLLNATFGNAVELLIAILALVKGDLDIVQASMIGSILSNILLVLGMSYFAGGLRFHEQMYGVVGAQMHISLLGITLTAIVMPAAYHFAFPSTRDVVSQTRDQNADLPTGQELDNLLAMSRGLSIILLFMYAMFLTFQLWTHAYLFRIPREKDVHPLPGPQPNHDSVFPVPSWVPSIADSSSTSSLASRSSTSLNSESHGHTFRRLRRWSFATAKLSKSHSHSHPSPPDIRVVDDEESVLEGQSPPAMSMPSPMPHPTGMAVPDGGNGVIVDEDESDDGIHKEDAKVKAWFAFGLLLTMTALAGVTAEWLVDSIDGLTESGNISREFVGLILLPVIGNSVEHITAVTVSVKDKLNLSMSIAVGSSIQVSLGILPILVLVGWAIGQPMLLFFDIFETITLVIAVLLVNFAISDGRTNWLEGATLMLSYICIALVAWFYDPRFDAPA